MMDAKQRERIIAAGEAELARVRRDVPLPAPDNPLIGLVQDDPRTYYLPPQPDRAQAPRLHAFWRWLFTREFRFIRPEFEIVPDSTHLPGGSNAGTARAGGFAGRWGTSPNWSGAAIAAHGGMLFESISASWRVPRAQRRGNVPAILANAAQRLPGGAWQASVWIGLDGLRRCSLSLPQVGTTSKVNADGSEEYYLWVQWWVRGRLFGEAKVVGFPVGPNDRIVAVLTVFSPTEIGFHVTNIARGRAVNVVWKSGEVERRKIGAFEIVPSAPDEAVKGDRSLAPAEGRHAVWCVERPQVMPTDAEIAAGIRPQDTKPFRFPAIGAGVFTDALALMRRRGSNEVVERDLTAARFIRMIERAEEPGPPRNRIVAAPARPGQEKRRMTVDQDGLGLPVSPVA